MHSTRPCRAVVDATPACRAAARLYHVIEVTEETHETQVGGSVHHRRDRHRRRVRTDGPLRATAVAEPP
ncbi:hypothetical protein BLAT2472_30162 [Burkholderia latens]